MCPLSGVHSISRNAPHRRSLPSSALNPTVPIARIIEKVVMTISGLYTPAVEPNNMTRNPKSQSASVLPTAKCIYTPGAHNSCGGLIPVRLRKGRSPMKGKGNGRKGDTGFEHLLAISRTTRRYAGEWVGIVDRRIVAHGRDARAVYKKLLELYPGREPEIFKIPKDRVMVL